MGRIPGKSHGITLILLVVVSPLGPWSLGSDTTVWRVLPSDHEQVVLELYGLIPPSASVLTQNNLYPLLSNRLNVHFLHMNLVFPPGTSFNGTMDLWTSTVDYILLDSQSSFAEAALLLSWPNVPALYSIIAAADGALLLERGNHSLSYFQPLIRSFGFQGVVPLNATLVKDPVARHGYALLHSNMTTSHFWYGPYMLLPPGNFTVSYRLKVDRPWPGPVIGLPVILHPMQLDAQVATYGSNGDGVFFQLKQLSSQTYVNVTELQGSSIPSIGAYFTVTMTFGVNTLGVYELPGHAATGSLQLWFDEVMVTQDTPSILGTIPIVWA